VHAIDGHGTRLEMTIPLEIGSAPARG